MSTTLTRLAYEHPVVRAAEELLPTIRKHAPESERSAKLADEVVGAAGAAGLFRIAAPREVGGMEGPLPALVAAAEVVGRADPAVGWYLANSTVACHASAYLPDSARAKLFASPDAHFGTSAVPVGKADPVDGGFRLRGRWPVVTGVEDAHYCALAGIVMDGDAPRQVDGGLDVRSFIVPTADIEILPTWRDAAGMRSTGSNAVRADDLYVEEEFAHTPAKGLTIDRPFFRLPIVAIFAPGVGGTACGIFSNALEVAEEELGKKVASFTGSALRDDPLTQDLIANARAALRSVRSGLLDAAAEVQDLVDRGEAVPSRLRAELYASIFYVVRTARRQISDLFANGSRDAFFQGNPGERALRDLHAIELGFNGVRSIFEASGRVFLGGEPGHPAF